MSTIFPEPIQRLPRAEVSLPGMTAFIQQGPESQVVFMEFSQTVTLPAHSHTAQWGIVVAGELELTIEQDSHVYRKGDSYFIPEGAVHQGKLEAGTAIIDYFDQKDRYRPSV